MIASINCIWIVEAALYMLAGALLASVIAYLVDKFNNR